MGNKNSSFSGLITGAMLIIVGIIWVLVNYGLIKFSIWKLWPLTVVFVGISILLKEKHFNNPLALIMILFGFSFLVANLRIFRSWHWYHAVNLWPTALIIIGVSMLAKRIGQKNNQDKSISNKEKIE